MTFYLFVWIAGYEWELIGEYNTLQEIKDILNMYTGRLINIHSSGAMSINKRQFNGVKKQMIQMEQEHNAHLEVS